MSEQDSPEDVRTEAPPAADAPLPLVLAPEGVRPRSLAERVRLSATSLVTRARRRRRALLLAALVFGPVTLTSAGVLIATLASRAPTPKPAATQAEPPAEPPPSLAPLADVDASALVFNTSLAAVVDAGAPRGAWRVAELASDPALVMAEGTIGKRPFVTALAAAGVGRGDVQRLLGSLDDLRRFDRCNPKDAYTVVREKKTGKLVAFEYATSPFEVFQAKVGDTGGIDAKRLDLRVERVPVAVAVTVGDDLRESIVKAGLDDDLLKMLDDALHGHVELASVRGGARLRILAVEDRVEGSFGRYAELEAVEYLPPIAHAPPLRVYHFGPPVAVGAVGITSKAKLGGYYDAKGRQPYHGGWRSPVPLARLSSRYNPRRMHPVLHIVMPHNGVDYAAPPGTPVYATAAGAIRSAGDGGPCGNMIQILHPNGLVSAYCHLSRFASVHVGQHVERRQLIGYVGQTGRATGPHLHFAVKRGESFVDPMAMKLDGVRVLPLASRDEFAKHREELDARLDAIALPAASFGDAGASEDGGEPEIIFDQPP